MYTPHPHGIIGSSVFHNVKQKGSFCLPVCVCVSISEAVPSIFHCRGGNLIIGNSVSHNVYIYKLHFPLMHMLSASLDPFYDVSTLSSLFLCSFLLVASAHTSEK